MKLYAVRKRRGQWAVCSEENTVLEFKTYDEAIETARSAVEVLVHRETEQEASKAIRPAGKPAGL